jgi:hypothetical protein
MTIHVFIEAMLFQTTDGDARTVVFYCDWELWQVE